ncbi:hypothetical protein R2F25_30280 [Streptomyces sp. UP1A-1]|nr:hypothetical protein [Streptomyces sp. UP1A-1]
MIALLLAAVVGFAVGYTARCVRPLARVDEWAWEQDYVRSVDLRNDPGRQRRPGWWAAQVVFAVEVAGLFIVHPRRVARQWRHRHGPPPPRGPAVTVTSTTDHASSDQQGTPQ